MITTRPKDTGLAFVIRISFSYIEGSLFSGRRKGRGTHLEMAVLLKLRRTSIGNSTHIKLEEYVSIRDKAETGDTRRGDTVLNAHL